MVDTTSDTETQTTDEKVTAKGPFLYSLAHMRDPKVRNQIYYGDAMVFVLLKKLGFNYSKVGETFTELRKGQK